ncbi:nucleotide sugar dehydrogenase [Ureibacillus manganicus]|uniref:Nucleotide sugar dehydrogenase n=1 Tax=Ureibacillus manganicus DSM 26584 TaxID=1384049 RepID=A0A0A3HYG6_9BACL|nr:nucleotide sugar dehydrogenase [Ureibacillus manganicus]KGR77651.1 nucleotide sugar dehydrogenase [Ureibacillus manganicus DSM 26584]
MSDVKGQVAIVGFGYIGSVIGAVLADSGFMVYGIEKNPVIVERMKNKKTPFREPGLDELIQKTVSEEKLFVTRDTSVVQGCETVIVTVGTPLAEDFSADTTQIEEAITSIKPYLQKNALVLIKSTVPPFTTCDLIAPLLSEIEGVKIAFCPERLAEGNAIREFKSIPIVVGGVDEQSLEAAVDFWKQALDTEVIEVSSATTAEMVKLSDNLWIDVNIALAGELAKLSDRLNIDVLEVIGAANTLAKGAKGQNVNILTPSVGVGGYCLTKDPWFVQHLGYQYDLDLQLPKTGRLVNDSMPIYSAALIHNHLAKQFSDPSQAKIAVLGIAFKNNTGDCRFTPTKPVIDELIGHGYKLKICDPWTTEADERLVTDLPVSKNIEETINGADCIAFLAGHNEFHALSIERMAELANDEALIFDGRRFFKRDDIMKMHELDLFYKGVGR